jgi:hypothetical protein
MVLTQLFTRAALLDLEVYPRNGQHADLASAEKRKAWQLCRDDIEPTCIVRCIIEVETIV